MHTRRQYTSMKGSCNTGLQVNRLSNRSCTWGMFHTKIHLIIPACPWPSIVLQCKIYNGCQLCMEMGWVFCSLTTHTLQIAIPPGTTWCELKACDKQWPHHQELNPRPFHLWSTGFTISTIYLQHFISHVYEDKLYYRDNIYVERMRVKGTNSEKKIGKGR